MTSDSQGLQAQSIVDALTGLAIFRTDADGMIKTWNVGSQRIKGYCADEALGQSSSIFYQEEDRQSGLPKQARDIAAQEGSHESEGWRLRKDRSRFWAHVIIEAVRDDTGAAIGFVQATRDITQRHEREVVREKLTKAQMSMAMEDITGGMAHDFNNILTAVLGCFDLLAQRSADSSAMRVIDSGINAAVRGQKLISQLLAFARKQVLSPEPTDVNDVIETLVPFLQEALGASVSVTTSLEPGISSSFIDQAHFQSALLNLMLNARDAMATGGRLKIRSYSVQGPGAEAGKGGRPAGFIGVSVEDNGSGMPPDVVERATEPFFSTRPVGQGNGLGLSQAYGFAIQSGGELQIESTIGHGTTVRLILPTAPQANSVVQLAMPPKKAILVVEDDSDVLNMVVGMLSAKGYQVYTAEDAAQALQILQRELPIDVLFTDIVMPGDLDGVDLARKAVHIRPNLSVLLTSGCAPATLRRERGIGGDINYLPKPYRWATLESALGKLIERRLGTSERSVAAVG